jgi:FkbM family methyltransferase
MKFLKHLFYAVSGTPFMQPVFEKLYKISLLGMNYGNGGEVEQSGEAYALKYIGKKTQPGAVVFDVGANKGQFASSVVKILGNEISLYCFEPSLKIYDILKKNLAGTNAVCVPMGLSDQAAERTLYSDPSYPGLSSVYQRRLDHYKFNLTDTEAIQLTTLDQFCETHNIPAIDFLKMDVEGHEMQVLKGATNMIRNGKIRFIQFEFGGTDIDSKTYFQDFWYLLHEKYTIYRIIRKGLYPIKQYNETLEIFTAINFLAELKD